MRNFYPFYFNNSLKTPDGKQGLINIKRNNKDYNPQYDYMRAMGRGVARARPTWFYQKGVWVVNGKMDQTDFAPQCRVW